MHIYYNECMSNEFTLYSLKKFYYELKEVYGAKNKMSSGINTLGYQFNGIPLDVKTDFTTNPYQLRFTNPRNNKSFYFNIEEGFKIKTFVPSHIYKLMLATLEIEYDSKKIFKPYNLLADFSKYEKKCKWVDPLRA